MGPLKFLRHCVGSNLKYLQFYIEAHQDTHKPPGLDAHFRILAE